MPGLRCLSFLGREAEVLSCPINTVGDRTTMWTFALGRKQFCISWGRELPKREPKKMFVAGKRLSSRTSLGT